MRINRRRFLTALGLGGLATGLPSLGWNAIARAGTTTPPKRLVLWITAHGTVPDAWNLAMPGLSTTGVATRNLSGVSFDDMPEILQPLHAHRTKLTCVEGLSQSTLLADHAAIHGQTGLDGNEHHLAMAHLLTSVPSFQREGQLCLGGGPSIDQVIGQRTREGGRWASRVYGANHYQPYSFTESGLASPRVDTTAQAFMDLMGMYHPDEGTSSRDDLIRAGRASVLDLVADEYATAARQLGTEGRRKLEQHAQLVRELEEQSFSSSALAPTCDLSLDTAGHEIDVWNRIITMLLACDMSRVVTFVAPILEPPDFGYPPSPNVHDGYAHSSVDDGNETFKEVSALAMTAYNKWYADRFARLLSMLDAIPEGSGSVLDHSNVVWLTELATGTHQHANIPLVVAGGGDGFFRTGKYVRYPRNVPSPWAPRGAFNMGPGLSRFHVTLMRAMGLSDQTFGQEEISLSDGTTHSLRGTLSELHV